MVSILDVNFLLKVAQLVEFWLVTPEVAGSKPVVQPIIYAALAQLVVRHLAMVEVTSSSLVCRLNEIHPANQNG